MKLSSENIVLRSLRSDDAYRLAELANNKKIWDNVRDQLPYPYTKKNATEFIDFCRQEKIPATFAIDYQGNLAGIIGLVLQKDIHKYSAELGYWIGEPYWNRNIATDATRLIVSYGFDQLGLYRIYAGVFDFNKASQRVLEKAGFQLEAIMRKAAYKNGRFLDEYLYSIIRD